MEVPKDLDLDARHNFACREFERVNSPSYLNELIGTIGADPAAG